MNKIDFLKNDKPTYSLVKVSQGWLWSDQEIKLLKEKACSSSIIELAELLNRPKRAIICKASLLKIQISERKNWTKADDEILIIYAGKEDLESLSKRLKRSTSSVMSRASNLKISTSKIHKRWSEEEKKFIVNNSDKYSAQDIAKKLNRSLSSIQCMASILKISLGININKWTEKELTLLKSMDKKETYEVAKRKFINRTSSSLYAKSKELNISFLHMEEKFIVEIDGKIKKDVLTIFSLHKELKQEGFPVGMHQGNWLKSPFFKDVIDINKLTEVDIFVSNGYTNSRPNKSYLLTSEQFNKIRTYYSKLKKKSLIPLVGMRSIELYFILKREGLINSLHHAIFLNLNALKNFAYEENISKKEFIYIGANNKWILMKGYYFKKEQILTLRKILIDAQLREKNIGSLKIKNMKTRIRKKYGEKSMDHLFSSGELSMVYIIENHSNLHDLSKKPKSYIGIWKSTNTEEYICSGLLVFRDILKYGPNKFTKRILYTDIDYENVVEKEIFFVSEYKTNEKQRSLEGHWGYNQTDGGRTSSYSSPVLIFDCFSNKEFVYSSMIEAELDLKLPHFSISGHINKNKRKNGIPYLLINKYIALDLEDKHLLSEKIKIMEKYGRINAASPVVCICPFTMKIIKKYKNADSASKDLKNNSSLAGDIRNTCCGNKYAMVNDYFWIFERDMSILKEKFTTFHKIRKHKMVKRIDTVTNEVKFYYYMTEAARDNNTNGHMIKNLMNNNKLFENRFRFKYIE